MISGSDVNWALYGACEGGHTDIVNLMFSKGTIYVEWGLQGACAGGHFNTSILMIQKGDYIRHVNMDI